MAESRPFRAKYEGTCRMCLRTIDLGELIRKARIGGGYYHANKQDCSFYKECTKEFYD